jgi:5'(3')-deoxyribonucleotidase
MNIYLDVDNTVIDSLTANVTLLNKRFGTNILPKDIHSWDFTDCFPNIKPKDIYETFDSDEFFEIVKLIPHAKDFIEAHAKDIIFTTIGTQKNLEKKGKLLFDLGFGDCRFLGIPTHKNKGSYDMSDGIIIDDAQKNLFASNAKRKILFNYRMDFTSDWTNQWDGEIAVDFREFEWMIYDIFNRHF